MFNIYTNNLVSNFINYCITIFQTLDQKVQQLNDLYQKKFVVKFNGPKFKEFVKSPPRNYSVIMMFTAMASHRQCSICG